MKWIYILLICCVAIVPVSAWIDFQNPDDVGLLNITNCTVLCGVQPQPFYQANISGGNAYFDNGAGGSMVATPMPKTYWAATIRRITTVGGGNIILQLQDSNRAALDTITTPFIDNSLHRYEIVIVGSVPYLYIDGILRYNKTSAMTANPSYVWVYSSYVSGYADHSVDDIIDGDTDSRIVLGMPQTGAYYIKKDFVNPASSGFYNRTTNALISSNYLSSTFSRSNISGVAVNESLYLINQQTGTVYSTQYTSNNTTGEVYWDIGSSLIAANAPYGWYQTKLNNTLSTDRISFIANGANINFDMRDYSIGDNATITYLVDPAYWQPGTYTYRIEIVDAYGTVHNSQNIAASSGSVSYTWTDADTQGVYFAEIIADRISNGEDILMNYDYATVTATFGVNGFVNTAGNATPISGSLVTYSQGDTTDNSTSGFDGNYSVSGFLTGIPIWANVSATGYQPQNFTFTVQNGHTITRNITLNATTASFTGVGVGGVARDGIFTSPNSIANGYGRPIPAATCHLKNTTNAESYQNITNNAAWYQFDESNGAFLTANRPYDLWCQKTGYSNTPNYTVEVVV